MSSLDNFTNYVHSIGNNIVYHDDEDFCDIKPDTDYLVFNITTYDDSMDGFYFISRKDMDILLNNNEIDTNTCYISFIGFLFTSDFYYKMKNLIEEYQNVVSENNNIRSSDEQYEDMFEYTLKEEIDPFKEIGSYSSDFFEYMI